MNPEYISPGPKTRPVVRFQFTADGVPEFVAMWKLIRELCERHGFPDDMLDVQAGMAFTGLGQEQLEALLAACADLDLSPHVRYEQW